jgi:hypothetical protein
MNKYADAAYLPPPPAPPPPPPAPPTTAVSAASVQAALALLGGIIMVAGSLGPWATAGFISVSGTQGDGKITLVAGAVALIFTVLMSTNKGGALSAAVAVLAALVGGGAGVVDLKHVQGTLQGLGGVGSVGWGLYAVIAGAALVAVGILLSAGKQR